MKVMTPRKRAILSVLATGALALSASVVVAAPAHAICSGAYLSVNTAAQASAKVPSNCTNGSQIRAAKDYYNTDQTNSTVGTAVGPWIGLATYTSTVYLPAGKFHKQNYIQSS